MDLKRRRRLSITTCISKTRGFHFLLSRSNRKIPALANSSYYSKVISKSRAGFYKQTSAPITPVDRTSSIFYTHWILTPTMFVKKSVKLHSVVFQLLKDEVRVSFFQVNFIREWRDLQFKVDSTTNPKCTKLMSYTLIWSRRSLAGSVLAY